MKPVIIYCYDAYCGWCYGFSPVIKQIFEEFKDRLSFEVLSGGMMPAENVKPVKAIAGFVSSTYKRVEELTGIEFGKDFLWHMVNPDMSDWFPHSEKSAIALCIFKEIFPEKQVEFATDLQYSLNYDGRDLTDDEAYKHLLEKYKIETSGFYENLKSAEYKEKAHYEFSLCKQLQVTGFPAMFLQSADTKFYLVARGYTHIDDVRARLLSILNELNPSHE